MKLYCKNFIDDRDGVHGIAVIFDNYEAHLHHHPIEERYDILYGDAKMHLSGETFHVSAGETIWIPASAVHNIKPISKYIIMRYYFPKGPFKDIKYTWLPSRL